MEFQKVTAGSNVVGKTNEMRTEILLLELENLGFFLWN